MDCEGEIELQKCSELFINQNKKAVGRPTHYMTRNSAVPEEPNSFPPKETFQLELELDC